MPKLKLTVAAIPKLAAKPDGRRQTYWDETLPGLYLQVHAGGVRSFGVWSRVKGRKTGFRYTLGRWQEGVFGLADAREKARAVLHDAALGRDPVAERQRQREAGNFGDLADTFLAQAQIRESTREEWGILLRHPRMAALRATPTGEVTRGELARLFDRIRAESLREGGKGYAANRTLEVVRRVFSWAVERDLVGASPCVGLKKPTKELPRQRSYSAEELGSIVRSLDAPSLKDTATSDAVRLCLYTGVRIETALGAPWSEFDLDAAEWKVSGERAGTKNGLPWLVPLVAPAVDLLRRLKEQAGDSEWVFPAVSGGGSAWRSQRGMLRIREACGVADFRPHDLRRTLNSWLTSRAGGAEPLEVRDAILGHAKRGLEATYNVHDYFEEKRTALERWAAYVERVAAAEPAKVVRMAVRA